MLSPLTVPQFVVVALVSHEEDREKVRANFDEVESLVTTFGGVVKHAMSQNAARKDGGTYIGKGKAREIAELLIPDSIDVVVINENLKSSQIFALRQIFEEKKADIEVWDRTDLILHIFDKHATTAEAKLQIKLANMRHKGPEMQGIGLTMSRQGGGIGTRGKGETITEVMKEHWRGEMRVIKDQLEKLTNNRLHQLEHRQKIGLPTISIVGYTNAGKSTLFNLMTKKQTLAEDALFATLDSSVGKVYLPGLSQEVFVSDTIGFIQNLPTKLVEAFTSTLMETVHATLLLHVIDISDPQMWDKIAVVENVLSELGIDTSKQIYVFNKIDNPRIADSAELLERCRAYHPQFMSARSGDGYQELIDAIQDELRTLVHVR